MDREEIKQNATATGRDIIALVENSGLSEPASKLVGGLICEAVKNAIKMVMVVISREGPDMAMTAAETYFRGLQILCTHERAFKAKFDQQPKENKGEFDLGLPDSFGLDNPTA